MSEISKTLEESAFFGLLLSLVAYEMGALLKKKYKSGIFNPLLISIIIIIAVLKLGHIDYEKYSAGAQYLNYLLTPVTVCLAVPLYEQLSALKKNWKAIILGIASGVIASMLGVLALALTFDMTHEEYVSLLPKSITTAIGMGVSEELGGYVSITVIVIILTGVVGNIIAELVFKIFHIKEPVARGIACGTASHAIGTAKAMELGEVEGAMSSLSIVVAGVITVFGAVIFAHIM
ncbi:MAG: LrgB family protein [Lachnospiraceae bacterium]|nr:LrgB family protein [Lachnospiraceae bacterium]